MSKKDDITWLCPNCGHNRYTSYVIGYFGNPNQEVPQSNEAAPLHPFNMYVCDHCTVMFKDPYFYNQILGLNYSASSIITNELREGYKNKLDIEIIRNNIKKALIKMWKENEEKDAKRQDKK